MIDRVVSARAPALRASYDPAQLAATAAGVARRALGQGAGPGARIGPSWVIAQVRWLHELERVCPADGPPDPTECAPPLDFGLPGLTDWPGARVGHRLRALRRHPLSMELEHNRLPAWTALLGEDDQAAFSHDLATLGVGLSPGTQLGHAAALMNVGPWLEVVLSWPGRFVAPSARGSAPSARGSAPPPPGQAPGPHGPETPGAPPAASSPFTAPERQAAGPHRPSTGSAAEGGQAPPAPG